MNLSDRDPEKMSRDDLLAYCYGLESRLQSFNDLQSIQARGYLQQALRLTRYEADVLGVLSDGRLHTKESILLGMYSDRVGDGPEIKIVDVFICKLRAKLKDTGIVIETIWGSGYKLLTVEPVAAVMRGEGLPSDTLTVGQPPLHKPVGAQSRPRLSVTESAIDYLHSVAVDGRAEVRTKDVSRACGATYGGATLLRNLERSGHIKVLSASARGGSQPWAIEMLRRAA